VKGEGLGKACQSKETQGLCREKELNPLGINLRKLSQSKRNCERRKPSRQFIKTRRAAWVQHPTKMGKEGGEGRKKTMIKEKKNFKKKIGYYYA